MKSCMIHGPCGDQNPNCVCMENGECKKSFHDETLENVKGIQPIGDEMTEELSWLATWWNVVPYNPFQRMLKSPNGFITPKMLIYMYTCRPRIWHGRCTIIGIGEGAS